MIRTQLNHAATPTPERTGLIDFSKIAGTETLVQIQDKNGMLLKKGRISRKEVTHQTGAIKDDQRYSGTINRMDLLHGTMPPVVPCPLLMDYCFNVMKMFPVCSRNTEDTLNEKQADEQNFNFLMAKGSSEKRDGGTDNLNSWPVTNNARCNIFSAVNKGDVTAEFTVLSQREKQVLELVSHGLTTKNIAQILSLPVKAVGECRLNIVNKCKVNNMCEAVAIAIRGGCIK